MVVKIFLVILTCCYAVATVVAKMLLCSCGLCVVARVSMGVLSGCHGVPLQ